jgi:hypothetical protein
LYVADCQKDQHAEGENTRMFSTSSILQNAFRMRQRLAEYVPARLCCRAELGFDALAMTRFISCNANARTVGQGSRAATEKRMYRLLRSPVIADAIQQLISHHISLDSHSVITIDFSDFGATTLLAAALQTDKGRAVPIAWETLASNTQGHHTNSLHYQAGKDNYDHWKAKTGGDQYDAVIRLVNSLDTTAPRAPKLVMDRGFANKRLLSMLFSRPRLLTV